MTATGDVARGLAANTTPGTGGEVANARPALRPLPVSSIPLPHTHTQIMCGEHQAAQGAHAAAIGRQQADSHTPKAEQWCTKACWHDPHQPNECVAPYATVETT